MGSFLEFEKARTAKKSKKASPARASEVISNGQRESLAKHMVGFQKHFDRNINKQISDELQKDIVLSPNHQGRASAGDQSIEGPASNRERIGSLLFELPASPDGASRHRTVKCDRAQHRKLVMMQQNQKDGSPWMKEKRLSTEFFVDEDEIKEQDDRINMPLVQVLHGATNQTPTTPEGEHDMSEHSAQKSQAMSVKPISITSSGEIGSSHESFDNGSDRLRDVRVQALSPQINLPQVLFAANDDIQYMSSDSSSAKSGRADQK